MSDRHTRVAGLVGALVLCFALAGVLASAASAVIVKLPGGGYASYQPLRGKAQRFDQQFSNLDYNGGPVMSSNTNYTIFWSPSGASAYPSGYMAGVNQYLTDLAADSGKATNVDSVAAQYNDATGNFANYQSAFGGSFIDTDPYPSNGCNQATICLTDAQLQAELSSFINAHGLPRDLTHEYFLLLPQGVENCFNASGSQGCSADSNNPVYCAYHGASSSSPVFIYSNDSYVSDNGGCTDFNWPNNNPSDGVLAGGLSHEHNESITDPLPNSTWTDIGGSGGEIGDKCGNTMGSQLGFAPDGSPYNQVVNGHFYWYQEEWSNQGNGCFQNLSFAGSHPTAAIAATGAGGSSENFDAAGSTAPGGVFALNWQFNDSPGLSLPTEVFPPTTTASDTFPTSSSPFDVGLTVFSGDGTSIGGGALITPGHSGTTNAINLPSNPVAGASGSFSAAVSTLDGSSITIHNWDFGDGTQASGSSPSHTYSAGGTYTVRLTIANSTAAAVESRTVNVIGPVSSFTESRSTAPIGTAISFDGSGSFETGGSISSYSWNFGDGSTGSGAHASHGYSAVGTYTVTLTVTGLFGATASSTQQVVVTGGLHASIAGRGSPIAGVPFRFTSNSTDQGSSITSTRWNFGDGSSGSGASVVHAFRSPGRYTVSLSVSDAAGAGDAVAEVVQVVAPTIGAVSLRAGLRVEKLTIVLTGPGTLRAGSAKITVRGPSSVVLRIRLSARQRATLLTRRHLTIHVKLVFTPKHGRSTTRRYRIVLRLP